MKIRLTIILIMLASVMQAQLSLPRVKVSSNGRYFQTEDGKPFFWLGDTGWLLFVKCTREDAILYLDTRQQQGFNVVQVMVLHDLSNSRNIYGDSALINLDASRPNITPGNSFSNQQEYDYWDHVDFIVDEAAKRGIYMALVPVWGSNVKAGKVNVNQGKAYAKFLAERYGKSTNIIWLNGGDVKGTEGMDVWKAIGSTVKQYDKSHIMTFHPRGRTSSSEWFHKEKWLDFNMFQSGHKNYSQDTNRNETNHYGEDNWKYVNVDYKLSPVKPTMDGEPSYENIPHGLHDSLQPRWTAADLRRYAYWSVFAGGAGFTYGENATMQFNTMGDRGANYGVRLNWKDAVNSTGAMEMQYLNKLMLSTSSYFDRVPAQEILVENNGKKYDYLLATKGKGFAMIYTYTGKPFKVDLSKLKFKASKAYWFNPTNGEEYSINEKIANKVETFNPPSARENGSDWVLILQ